MLNILYIYYTYISKESCLRICAIYFRKVGVGTDWKGYVRYGKYTDRDELYNKVTIGQKR